MTTASEATGPGASKTFRCTIDGVDIDVAPGTLVIRAAEMIGVQIPRFCDHPLLDPVGACRQCLVEIELPGRSPGSAPVRQPKPVASCTITVTDGMVVRTQHSSPMADKAQRGVMELLLINHPLDCPICDKGGECPLQNQAMSNGRAESRFTEQKRTFRKPIPISAQVLLDRERCVQCARCTRFAEQIAGDPSIELLERGASQQVGIYANEPFSSYFSGNTVQICPVGALTSVAYRFRARPYDLVSSPTVCEHCASGCAQRTDHRRGVVLRRLAGDDPAVNEEWNCDKGRWAFSYATAPDRIGTPLVRRYVGVGRARSALVPASWSEALAVAARGLSAAHRNAGVLVGGRATVEDAYAYAKFARVALATNDIDFRIRAHSAEEADFLAARVAGNPITVSYADLENAATVLLVAFEPEEESPIVFLRLRKAARTTGLEVLSIAPYATRGLAKMRGRLLRAVPGAEAAVLDDPRTAELLGESALILVGERLAGVPGGLSAAIRLAERTGARPAWVPRRAGERGALEAGAVANLLPGGRPVADEQARRQVAAVWNVADLPAAPGRDTAAILAAKGLGALVLGGVDVDDLPDPRAALAAIDAAGFVVSLELRHSAVTDRAHVVFPVAPVAEKPGAFVNWEGRERRFTAALANTPGDTHALSDQCVLDALADTMGCALGLATVEDARRELARLDAWNGVPAAAPNLAPGTPAAARPGEAVLASWRMLLDAGRLQDGEPDLAGTARAAVVRLSPATAAEIDAVEGDPVTVSTDRGAITLPLAVTDLPDRVVWLPLHSPACAVYRQLATTAGCIVGIRTGEVS